MQDSIIYSSRHLPREYTKIYKMFQRNYSQVNKIFRAVNWLSNQAIVLVWIIVPLYWNRDSWIRNSWVWNRKICLMFAQAWNSVTEKLCLIDLSNLQIYHALRTHLALYRNDRLLSRFIYMHITLLLKVDLPWKLDITLSNNATSLNLFYSPSTFTTVLSLSW